MIRRILCVGLALSMLAACTGSALPSPVLRVAPPSASTETGWTEVRYWNRIQFYPTTMHAYIYSLMEECTGLEGDFFAINWSVVDFLLDVETLGRKFGGWAAPLPREILLDRRTVNDPVVVSHEAIHDLLGGGDHDDPRFAECEIRPIPLAPR